jgi:hypothetical protein
MLACSQSWTAGSTYADGGSMRDAPKGAYAAATSSAGSGAVVPRS